MSELKMIARSEWSTVKAGKMKQFETLPVWRIYYSINSGLPECNSQDECKKVLLEAQKKAMTEDKLPDIPYNFIIGNDGTVYEGRGWQNKPDKAIVMEPVNYEPNVYDITFFGDYTKTELPTVPFRTSIQLLEEGRMKKFVDPDYDMEPVPERKFKPPIEPGPQHMKKIVGDKDNPVIYEWKGQFSKGGAKNKGRRRRAQQQQGQQQQANQQFYQTQAGFKPFTTDPYQGGWTKNFFYGF